MRAVLSPVPATPPDHHHTTDDRRWASRARDALGLLRLLYAVDDGSDAEWLTRLRTVGEVLTVAGRTPGDARAREAAAVGLRHVLALGWPVGEEVLLRAALARLDG